MTTSDLSHRAALVTGAGRGIGRVVAEALASAGAAVTLTARSADELEAAAAAIEASGGRAIVAPADVGDPAAVAAVAAAAGGVDVLVTGAGVLPAIGPAGEAEPDDWWANVETTLRGASLCPRAVLPGMIARGRGTIVNLASGVAGRPEPYLSGYRAGKAALV